MDALFLGTGRFQRKRAMNRRLRPLAESLETRTLLDGQGFNLGDLVGREEVSGTLLNSGELSNDVVSFRLSAPGWVDARCDFAFPNSNGPGALKLLDAKGKQLAADGLTSGVGLSTVVNQSFPILLAPGDYQIQVGRTAELPENQDPGYKLFVVADYAGDNFSNARDGGVLALLRSYTDFVGTLADVRVDVDYYKFTVPTPRTMQAALTANGDPTFLGFQVAADTNNDGVIDSYLTQPKSPGELDLTVPAGTIYVVVGFGSNGATPPPSYTLSVSARDSTPPATPKPQISLSRNDIDFGSVTIRHDTAASFTITNVGAAGSVLSGTLFAPTAPFAIDTAGGTAPPGDFSIPAGKSITVALRFAPMPASSYGVETASVPIVIRVAEAPGGTRQLRVYLSGVSEPAAPTDFWLVPHSATKPDNGVLIVDVHFRSTSGVVADLFNESIPLLSKFKIREVLTVAGTSAKQVLLPRPFWAWYKNPTIKSIWRAFIREGIKKISNNEAVLLADRHGYDVQPLLPKLREGHYTIQQTFEYSYGAAWTPVPHVQFNVTRRVHRASRLRPWYYSVSITDGKSLPIVRQLPLTVNNRRRYNL